MKAMLLVGAGGFAGSVARYLITLLAARWFTAPFPLGTFAVNVLGSLLIGIIMGLGLKSGWMSKDLYLLLATGFCGGFTTFSTFSAENVNLLSTGNYLTAGFYLGGSILLGVGAVMLGLWLVK